MKHPTSTHSFGKVAFWSILLSILLLIVMSLSITLGAASIDFIVVWKVVLSKIPIVQNWVSVDWKESTETNYLGYPAAKGHFRCFGGCGIIIGRSNLPRCIA